MAERTPGLWIGEDLAFPPDVVTETLLIIAKRGSGKTHCASVLVEEMVSAGLPVAVIDPIGVWWGLRSSADGQGPGLPVMILGGEHADLPLPPESGTLVADLVIDERVPVVLDLSLMSKTQQRRFVTDFLERIYHRNRDPLHLVIDEADLYAPLRGAKESARLLGAYEDIVRRGRARGLGCTSITQRPAVLHTDIRSQAEVLIALRLIGTHDVAAIDDWIRLHATDEEARQVKASLPSLPIGTAWVWSPGWLELLAKVKIRQRLTFDSSATPKVGQQRIVPREFARVDPADLERLGARISTAVPGPGPVKTAGSDETQRLAAEVARLRSELAAAQAREPERVEVPVLAPGEMAAIEQHIAELRGMAGSLEIALSRAVQAPKAAVPAAPRPPVLSSAAPPPVEAGPVVVAGAAPARASLKAGERNMLATLARMRHLTVNRAQLGALTGFAASGGTFKTYLNRLRQFGLAVADAGEITITDAGLAATGDAGAPLTGTEIRAIWDGALKAGERAMLDVLIGCYPAAASRADLGSQTGFEPTGGTFKTYINVLKRNMLAEEGPDGLRAADVFFLAEATR